MNLLNYTPAITVGLGWGGEKREPRGRTHLHIHANEGGSARWWGKLGPEILHRSDARLNRHYFPVNLVKFSKRNKYVNEGARILRYLYFWPNRSTQTRKQPNNQQRRRNIVRSTPSVGHKKKHLVLFTKIFGFWRHLLASHGTND